MLSSYFSSPCTIASRLPRVSHYKRGKLLVCDIQERFRPLVHRMDSVIHMSNVAMKAAHLLEDEIHVTEQYPERLGATGGIT